MKIILISILINLFFIFFLKEIKKIISIHDYPDMNRKLHKEPVFLGGGLLFYLNLILASFLIYFSSLTKFDQILSENIINFFIFCSLFFFLGVLDDKYNLKPNLKAFWLILFIIGCLLLDKSLLIRDIRISFTNDIIELKYLSLVFTIFCFFLFINSLNLFDGINLQSGIYFLQIFFSIFFYISGSYLILVIIISTFFFLYMNFKNKIFLGDSGSIMMGFIISYIFIKIYNNNYQLKADYIFLLMSLPGIDMIRIFFFRLIKKKNPFLPDRNHIHHILCNKFGLIPGVFIIQIIIFIPNVLFLSNFSTLPESIIIMFIFYFLLFLLSKNKEQ